MHNQGVKAIQGFPYRSGEYQGVFLWKSTRDALLRITVTLKLLYRQKSFPIRELVG
jgi:hypothetical protein